ncbi:MAG: endonuclease III domain-containing protein [Acidobacteriaceae bacterium]
MDRKNAIRDYFDTLQRAWGPQHWWPAESPFEVIVGAILTQNTAWTNVDLALTNLRRASSLTVDAVRELPQDRLEQLVRPAGFFRQKASRLKRFVHWLDEAYGGSLDRMFSQPTAKLRSQLLALNGIGPETADSILLYAGQHEIFVVDAYTRRVLQRHGLVSPEVEYDGIRSLVEAGLQRPLSKHEISPSPATPVSVERGPGPAEESRVPTVHLPSSMSEAPRSELAQRYNEFHALIVQVGKHYCQSRVARCEACPLRVHLPPHAEQER